MRNLNIEFDICRNLDDLTGEERWELINLNDQSILMTVKAQSKDQALRQITNGLLKIDAFKNKIKIQE